MSAPVSPPPTGLPVEAAVPSLREALAGHGVAVLVAPPGAGKTTVVPLRLLDEPWLGRQRIVVLEPRKLAARAAAQRMASLLNEPLGTTVGYRTRDERVGGRDVRIEVITEGILVRRLQQDPSLVGTGLVVLDEVHERNLVTDLSLALALDARSGLRPELRILAMSATLDSDRLAGLMGDGAAPAPVIRSEGRQFPVAIEHLQAGPRDTVEVHAARAVGRALAEVAEGDVLVFLPGAAQIRRVADRLGATGGLPAGVDVRPLFGALAVEAQDLALQPSPPGRRRVVLATDIAESSLTVAGVRVVVDAGEVRVPHFDPATGMTRLRTEPASVASADQRAGRAGRLGPGVAIRLWDPSDRARRPRFAVPEITVTDLTGLALELAVWGASPAELRLLDPPPATAFDHARQVLVQLGALGADGRPTRRGRAMAELPVHPRLAAMVVDGVERGQGWTACVLAALLEERDVLRGRPGDLPVDLVLRAELVDDRRAHHPGVDAGARRTARRRAEELARRARCPIGSVHAEVVGALVAVAHPERIAQVQGVGGYRFRGGGGGRIEAGDELAGAPFLAVAEVESTGTAGRILRAAPLTEDEVRAAVAGELTSTARVSWDAGRDDVRARVDERAGALVLSSTDRPASPGPETTACLLDRVRATDGAVLPWSPSVRALQARVAFLHQIDPDAWPDTGDRALLASLDDWLAPLLAGAAGRADLARIDLRAVVLGGHDHARRAALDLAAPTSFAAADGRQIPITYDDGRPRAAARVQWLFGMREHPTIEAGEPVVVELLSPAGRPIQVTADLPGFWAGSWSEVRKDMAGRYPKHDWPLDPAVAAPPVPRRRR